MIIYGVDFTSAPSRRKAITVAEATLRDMRLTLRNIELLVSFDEFERLLARAGPWFAGFDLPFGLPRELVEVLGWPAQWGELMEHLCTLDRRGFAQAMDGVRTTRPQGSRYIARRGDRFAGSSSPMKLVNPPVGLMLFEGATRLWKSGVRVEPCRPNSDSRVALEAYPGYFARKVTRASYKKDGPEGRTEARKSARELIATSLENASTLTGGLAVQWSGDQRQDCIDDGNGDRLDAVICALQAAIAYRSAEEGDARFGIPADADPLEGWVATVPAS